MWGEGGRAKGGEGEARVLFVSVDVCLFVAMRVCVCVLRGTEYYCVVFACAYLNCHKLFVRFFWSMIWATGLFTYQVSGRPADFLILHGFVATAINPSL
jgi:hypothetical protein